MVLCAKGTKIINSVGMNMKIQDVETIFKEIYPYFLINYNTKEVLAKFSTLEKAHENRLLHELLHPEEGIVLLVKGSYPFDSKNLKVIDWRKKERILYEKYKNNPRKYLEILMKKR